MLQVSYGFEIWFVILMGRESSVFENKVLRRIYGPEENVMGCWRKLNCTPPNLTR
jgi:hypothetical protein